MSVIICKRTPCGVFDQTMQNICTSRMRSQPKPKNDKINNMTGNSVDLRSRPKNFYPGPIMWVLYF